MPADPGNKTDETDLYAQHRAAVAGFGLCEFELEPPYRALQLRVRHRRNLVEKAAAIACQIREHLHLAMPGFATLFDHLFDNKTALAITRRCDSPAKVIELGQAGLSQHLRENKVRHQSRTIDKVLAWASRAACDSVEEGPLHHAIWTDLEELYQRFQRRISALEQELASDLVGTPYIRLLAIPGINVVSAADLAGRAPHEVWSGSYHAVCQCQCDHWAKWPVPFTSSKRSNGSEWANHSPSKSSPEVRADADR